MKNIRSDEGKQRLSVRLPSSRFRSLVISFFCLSFFLFACQSQTQKSATTNPVAKSGTESGPSRVAQIDVAGLQDVLKPSGKPRLINFWATWCGPCREEFPDLVKIGADYKGKIDLITVSLDDPSEIDSAVPEFLAEMNSESPAYLLRTPDEDAAIEIVSKDWQGALPFTILFSAQGETIYSKQGKFNASVLASEIERLQ